MKRIYHRYEKWEDYRHQMYCDDLDDSSVDAAIAVLSNPIVLKDAMMYVAENWKNSAELNLSNTSRNRQAWLGQAACCWLVHSSERSTKEAWNLLDEEMRIIANQVADQVIEFWEKNYAKKNTR